MKSTRLGVGKDDVAFAWRRRQIDGVLLEPLAILLISVEFLRA